MEHILIVDDEQPMRELLKFHLLHNGFEVSEAFDSANALALVHQHPYDLLIVDWMMPDMDGRQLCRQIRTFSHVPIIMLTARNQLQDKVQGFENGADDYLTKPFEEAELIARIKALLRRTQSASLLSPPYRTLHYKGITMNLDTREVLYQGEPLNLTAHEFDMLKFMIRHAGQALSRDQIIENAWGFDYEGDYRTVDSHIRNLRAKLKQAGIDDPIKTLWGVGYKLS